jgi:hypothetical protein
MRHTVAALAAALLACSLAAPPAAAGPSEREAALAQSLRTRRISSVALEKASLDDVVRYLRVATGLNFHVRREVIAKAGIDLDALTFTLDLDDVTVASLLELVLRPHGLAAVVRGNIVHVTTKADALGPPVSRLYAISHLTWRLTDFVAPSLDLHPSGYTPPEEDSEVVREDGFDADQIATLVREQVPVDWSQEGWGISVNARFLVVRAPRSVQAQVAAALARIEAFR